MKESDDKTRREIPYLLSYFYGILCHNWTYTPSSSPRNRQNSLIRKHHIIMPDFQNKFAINQILPTDSNEVFSLLNLLCIQQCAGNNALFTRWKMNPSIVDTPLKKENFVGKKISFTPDDQRHSEVISDVLLHLGIGYLLLVISYWRIGYSLKMCSLGKLKELITSN